MLQPGGGRITRMEYQQMDMGQCSRELHAEYGTICFRHGINRTVLVLEWRGHRTVDVSEWADPFDLEMDKLI